MEFSFCTISSSARLYQCLALYNSLLGKLDNIKFYVLCMDQETYSVLNALKNNSLVPIELESMEDDTLLELKGKRDLSEYCWTMKPVFIECLMENYPEIARLTYLDADLFFFSNPKPIFTFGFGKSVWLTPHNYNENIKYAEKEVGRYNSGFISFKNNRHGLECLRWWKENCLEWCYNTTVGGKFGDQKYLDIFDSMFYGVTDIRVPGVNVAPWNDEESHFSNRNGKVYVNGNKLICYHFCGFKVLNEKEFIVQFGNKCNDIIHKTYMTSIKNTMDIVRAIDCGFKGCYTKAPEDDRFHVFSI